MVMITKFESVSETSPTDRPVTACEELRFSNVDADASGTVELEELQNILPQIPQDQLAEIFKEADLNKDGKLDRAEYMKLIGSFRVRTENFVEAIILPRKQRTAARRLQLRTGDEFVEVDKKFPIFIVWTSVTQWLFFLFMSEWMVQCFIFNPYRRYEAWRFLSVMLIHVSWLHFWGNIILQLILGCLLEMIHHHKRVIVVYLSGVLFGTLASSVVQPWTFLIGASGGVYALLVAHLSTIILNWNEMDFAFVRCFALLLYMALDITLVLVREVSGIESNTSYAGHFGGALAGLLVGINVMRNFEEEEWEVKVQKVCRVFIVIFLVFTVIANVTFQILYFTDDQDMIKVNVNTQNVTELK